MVLSTMAGMEMASPAFNPYQPPAALEELLADVPLSVYEARQRLQLPAYGQVASGVFGILVCLFLLWALIIADPHKSSTLMGLVWELFLPVLLVLGLMSINAFIISGGLAMLRVRHYRLARLSAVITVAFLGGSCLAGLPFGIWALIILNDRRVRAAFAAHQAPASLGD
jgi:hypothetical protein